MQRSFFYSCLFIVLLSGLLTSCMMGPDFHHPRAPKTSRYTESPQVKKTVSTRRAGQAGKAQHFVMRKDIPGDWWYLYHSPEINKLIAIGLKNSPNLAAAKAALVQAKENFNAQMGTLLPTVAGSLFGGRERENTAAFGGKTPAQIFNLYNASVSVAYTLDLFGAIRRQIEGLDAQVEYERFELEAAFLTLSANIVTTSITIASLREQIKATHELIKSEERQLHIIEKQFYLGGASKASVLTQQTTLAQTRATLPPLEQSLAQNYHALSVLIGELPSEDQLPKFDLNSLQLPTEIPLGIPCLLVRQRPDIRAAEAQLHNAIAQIGVATANLYPQFTVNGTYGWEGLVLSTLINPNNIQWSLIPTISIPIFNGGSLFAKKRAAVAAYEQAAAQYKQTVLQGFQNVADSLRALEHDALSLQAQKQAEISARDSLALTEKQYRLGGVSYINLLIAQQQYQQTRIARIQAQASRYTDTAALFQALGGGWWNRQTLDCNKDLSGNLCRYTPAHFNKV